MVTFCAGIVFGVVSAIRATNGEFERVARIDMEFGAAKVFFVSALALVGCYRVIVVAGLKVNTIFISIVPFFVIGFFMGEYATALIARYELMGVLNMIFVYIPLFCGSCTFLSCALCKVMSTPCGIVGCTSQQKQPLFLSLLKIFAMNVACNFVFVMIVGSIIGVILVSLY